MKKRIIPSILLRGGTQVCLSQSFSPWRSVGALAQNLRLHVKRSADELLIINLDQAGGQQFVMPERVLRLVRQEVDIPIAYAGGIRSAFDAALCINAGFDKVFLTSAFLDDPTVLSSIADVVGTQSLGLVLPYKRINADSEAMVWDYRSKNLLDLALQAAIESSITLGVGEVLLHDVSRDGTLSGFDPLIVNDMEKLQPSIPILLAGGAGDADHISCVLGSSWIQGIAASSIFSLTSATPVTIRKHCAGHGISMRRCSYVST
ncbi:MAG: HisA/HisF-related TIM barrel protein [Cyanobium sp.]